jgi:hypothetical protein
MTDLYSKTRWRNQGRGIKDGQDPVKTVLCHGRYVDLYSIEQTTTQKPYTIARNDLLNLFANWPDRFGYETPKGEIYQVQVTDLRGAACRFLEKGFNYAACKKGIKIPNVKTRDYIARGFHIAAPEKTRLAVIDLDNHEGSQDTTHTHLRLITAIQGRMNDLIRLTGATSSFFQYRQIEPTGIQIWLITNPTDRTALHQKVRQFLVSLGANLDRELQKAGLASLNSIEVGPTSRLISMPGIYGKSVFTSHELKISKNRFDCEGLANHIRSGRHAGDVLKRYSELACVSFSDIFPGSLTPVSEKPIFPISLPDSPLNQKAYWSQLKDKALNGLSEQDDLHDLYLEPLAHALMLREFHDDPRKIKKTIDVLKDWVFKKHNNCITRLNKQQFNRVEAQIHATVDRILKKPLNKKIEAYFSQMRVNDLRFPHRKELLVPLMQANPTAPPSILIGCKGCISGSLKIASVPENKALPASVKLSRSIRKALRDYCKNNLRKGISQKGFKRFAERLISEIGTTGVKVINEQRLQKLAGRKKDADTSFLKRWKKHLVKVRILRKGWEKNIIRGVRSSQYELHKWVVEELATLN